MTTLDRISLGFVAVCAIGIAYLILVEPIRQRLHDDRYRFLEGPVVGGIL
jgi:hypothetical protein